MLQPKNVGLGVDFRLSSEGDFLTGRPYSYYVVKIIEQDECMLCASLLL